MIIALGETIIATAKGVGHRITETESLVAVVASMALISALWWAYFGGDDEEAAEVLHDTPADQQAYRALIGYSLTHLLHVFGLVLIAAGLHDVMHDPGHLLDARIAVTMAAGVATYLCGEALFRATLGIGSVVPLLAGMLVAVATAPLGTQVSGLAELIALGAVVAAVVALTRTGEVEPPVTSAEGSAAPA